jgi:hypothetical protein
MKTSDLDKVQGHLIHARKLAACYRATKEGRPVSINFNSGHDYAVTGDDIDQELRDAILNALAKRLAHLKVALKSIGVKIDDAAILEVNK